MAEATDVRIEERNLRVAVQEHRARPRGRRVGGEADSGLAVAGRLAGGRGHPAVQPGWHDADDPEVPVALLHGRRAGADRHADAGRRSRSRATAIEHNENILISGGTSTGKTTLLNALASFLPTEDRVVLIEETAELQIDQAECGAVRSPAGAGAICRQSRSAIC